MSRKERRAVAKSANAEAICRLADVLLREGKTKKAEKAYQQALAIDPGRHAAHNNLANLFQKQGRYDDAGRHFREAINLSPDTSLYYNNAAVLLTEIGQTTDAVKFHAKALDLQPDYVDAHIGLGLALTKLGQLDEAIGSLRRALDHAPENLLARIHLGSALASQGRIVEALDQAEIASHSSENASFPHYQLGLLLARCGAPDAARSCFETHLKRDPQDRDGVRLLLAGLGALPIPERASRGQLDHLYACRASHYDEGAAGATGYRGADLVSSMFERLTAGRDNLDVIDAGCGTGLVGSRIASRTRRLVGVDASLPMLAKAREKGVYHDLRHDDLVGVLNGHADSFDVVTCAGTLIHFGDLRPVFQSAAASLRDGGLFIFTLFPHDSEIDLSVADFGGYAEGGCYRHSRSYVVRLAAATGFEIDALEFDIHEYVQGRPKTGLVGGLRRIHRAQAQPAAA
jgi:predicted TPR repeat methyltransferase